MSKAHEFVDYDYRANGEACGCEHSDHDNGTAHAPYGVPAGRCIAAYVGAVCDDCANGHVRVGATATSVSPAERRV